MRYCMVLIIVLILGACGSQATPTVGLPPRATVEGGILPPSPIDEPNLVEGPASYPTPIPPPPIDLEPRGLNYLAVSGPEASTQLPEPLNDAAGIETLRPWRTVGFGIPRVFAFSPDETRLAVGTSAGVVHLQMPSLEVIRFDRIDDGAQGLQFDSTGTMIDVRTIAGDERYDAIGGAYIGAAGPWNDQPQLDPSWVILSPFATYEAEFQVPDTIPPPGVVVRQVANSRLLYTDSVSIAGTFSPDERYLVLKGNDEIVRLVELETGAVTQLAFPTFSGGTFSPDGQTLLTSGRSLHVWDVVSGQLIQSEPLRLHEERPFLNLEFTFQDILFDATASTVTVFAHYTGFESESPQRTSWTVDGSSLGEELWSDWLPSVGMQTFTTYQSAVNPAAPQALISQDGFVLEWLENQEHVFVESLPVQVTAIQYSPDGSLVVLGLADGRVVVKRTSDRASMQEIQTSGHPQVFGFSPDGTLLAVFAAEGTLTIVNMADGSQVNQFSGTPVDPMSFSPLRSRTPIFTADNEWVFLPDANSVDVYAVTGTLVGSLDGAASSVAIGPYRRLMLTVDDGIVTLWGRQ